MQNIDLQAVAETLTKKLFVELEASGRHVHVTKEQAQALFGHELTEKRPLSQLGQYLSNERVTVMGPKGELRNVAVLGPERKDGQVEISMTDGRALGITPPVRLSGDLEGTPGCVLVGSAGSVKLDHGVIVARRHIHMSPEDAAAMGVEDRQKVKLQVYTDRPVIFEDVTVRIDPYATTSVHLDYDEANACGFRTGDLGRILP